VTFQPIGKRIVVKAGTSLLEAGRAVGLSISANCGGVGICGKCRVKVVSGKTSPPSRIEQAFLDTENFGPDERLACEACVVSSVVVELPPEFDANAQRLQVVGDAAELICDPNVESHQIALDAPSLQDSRSHYRRVADALNASVVSRDWTIQPAAAVQFSRIVRQSGWNLTVFSRGSELIGFSGPAGRAVGLAVDVGCTKIAAYLLDLQTGKQLASQGITNPQIPYGEDLITRLVFVARDNGQTDLMANLVRDAINKLAADLCFQAKVSTDEIAELCIVGNTAMTHLLLGLPVEQLLHAPFVSSIDRDIDMRASELALKSAPGANVHILPGIGGFIGADHVAMILAHGIDRSEEVVIGIDIGTNTEIVLHNPRTDAIVSTSVPSGPAFEGGHVRDGIRAASGAIEKVFFVDRVLEFRTIDNCAPLGICGSGIVDLLAELWRLNYIDERGHLLQRDELVRSGKHGLEFLVVAASQSGHGRDIVLTQHDITEIQLAKAAIHAGIAALLEITDTNAAEVEEMVVAGAFGSYMDLRNSVAIGLLPYLPHASYLQIGNAAGSGAKMALVSNTCRERARMIAQKVTKVELKKYENFNRLLARATRFPAPRNKVPTL